MKRRRIILHAPSPLGLMPPKPGHVPGVRFLAETLRELGLHDALKAEFAGTVEPPDYDPTRHPEWSVRNARGVASYSVQLADAAAPLINETSFLLMLGGDCSITIGLAEALRRHGRFGLIYIDGHSDCQTPEVSQTGGIAGMPLTFITGNAPEYLAEKLPAMPLLAEEDVVIIGCRDLWDITGSAEHRYVTGRNIRVFDLAHIRDHGAQQAATDALRQFDVRDVGMIWLHLDADVLDPAIMPAVDSPDPGGLTEDELTLLLSTFIKDPRVAGMHVTIYDPERDDAKRSAGRLLVRILCRLQ